MRRDGSRAVRSRTVQQLAVAFVAVAAAAGLGAWWAGGQETDVAKAIVLVHPLEGNAYSPGGRGDELVNLATEAEVLRSDAVARAVAVKLAGDADADALLSGISVAVPPSTQLLEITARAEDGRTAATRATVFAETYLEFRRARTESDISERTGRLQDLVTARERERSAAVARLDKVSSGGPTGVLLTQQVQDLTSQIGSLRAQLAAAQAVSQDPGQVVTPGTVAAPSVLADPLAMGLIAGGVAAALCLGVVLARRSRRANDTVRGPDDLQGLRLPLVRDLGTRVAPDALARFRTEILALKPDRPVVVTVGAVDDDEVVSFWELVESFLRARYEVVAIDLTDHAVAAAVTEVVLGDAGPAEVLVERRPMLSEPRSDALGDGRHRDAPLADVVASSGMVRALAELGKNADVLLVRCDGLLAPVGATLVPCSDAVVLEVHPGSSTRTEVEDLVEAAAHTQTPVVGVVVVRQPRSRPMLRRRTPAGGGSAD
ncbi:hypothetical protein JK386_01465 [Nocardioides sp. zg-536]|uniref:Polysaccharide chain length determinant N-terminal domain-containing protein n=1 Tax=Nocardioides faecalis TaxID=2803858 RepID=A0A939BWN8_9ACTN|nr:hypothetical protein [Nocardioides faecalis]MBM9458563.1 hypothetical protein [Nocardioides faecalis]MBS4752894.1 hypothetical protein [Nocardioides faecalis]QVI58565.1 hypothetical protein KG111_16555 [Nocardioides faecalis]